MAVHTGENGPATPATDVVEPRAVDVRLAHQTDAEVDEHASLAVDVAMGPRATADIDMVSEPSPDTLAPGTTGMDLGTNANDSSMGYPRRSQIATHVPITSISPIPKVAEQTPRKSHHRRGETCIITLSPYKEELQHRQKARTSKDEPQPSGSGTSGIAHPKSSKRERAKICNSKQDDTHCLHCCEMFVNSRSGEKWIQCGQCNGWAHEDCTDFEGGIFTCDICADD